MKNLKVGEYIWVLINGVPEKRLVVQKITTVEDSIESGVHTHYKVWIAEHRHTWSWNELDRKAMFANTKEELLAKVNNKL